jgi:N-formylglutamate amidohydrolase
MVFDPSMPHALPDIASPIEILAPPDLLSPLVFASPHSGSYYPPDFVTAAALELSILRKSEDCYVDELFADTPNLGAPLLRALYPRAYLDVNREPYELDPEMFDQSLPAFVNSTSARVAAGLGTIARIVATRREIYRHKLPFAEAERRINGIYKPYHRALRELITRAWQRFGFCILIDCHSMPSTGLPMELHSDERPIDMVLGDRSRLSCAALVTDTVDGILTGMGYRVTRNNPYAGGFTTQHYGDPANGIHAIQIEINRAIYVDETTLQRRVGFAKLKSDLSTMIRHMSAFAAEHHRHLRYQRLSAE